VLVVLQGLLLLGLVRAVYQLQQAGPGSQAADDYRLSGRPAPHLAAQDISGNTVDSSSFAGRLTALLFVSPTCENCSVTLDDLDYLATKTAGNIIVLCRATRDECKAMVESHGLTIPVVADEDFRISEAFKVMAAPTALLIDPKNRIVQYGHPLRGEELEEMLRNAAAGEEAQDGSPERV
jgi:peroxiredoxin